MVALITAQGQIVRGNAPARARVVSAGAMRDALRAARKDNEVKAVVLRIDSPGGDAVASATIWREIHALRAAGKPVVASMGNVAASGGYMMAVAAEKIVALPTTITGSIGVLAGQPDLSGFLRQQRGKVETIALGAEPRSVWRPLSSAQRARLNETIDAMYADFKSKVADGRGLSARRVEAAAKGRVWTGRQAKRRGLVDALGGTDEAVAIACAAAGLSAAVEVRPFPPAPTLAKVFESMGEEEEEGNGGNGGGGGGGSASAAPSARLRRRRSRAPRAPPPPPRSARPVSRRSRSR